VLERAISFIRKLRSGSVRPTRRTITLQEAGFQLLLMGPPAEALRSEYAPERSESPHFRTCFRKAGRRIRTFLGVWCKGTIPGESSAHLQDGLTRLGASVVR
jgi:hypothetical protein